MTFGFRDRLVHRASLAPRFDEGPLAQRADGRMGGANREQGCPKVFFAFSFCFLRCSNGFSLGDDHGPVRFDGS